MRYLFRKKKKKRISRTHPPMESSGIIELTGGAEAVFIFGEV